EPAQQHLIRRQLRAQHLHRDLALQRDLLAAIHRAHAALAELLDDAIAPGDLAADEIALGHRHRIRAGLGRDRLLAARGAEPRVVAELRVAVRASLHVPSPSEKIPYSGSGLPRNTRSSTRRLG